jgi:hypothetical protein
LVKEEQMDEKIETTSHQAQDRMGNIDIDPNNPLDIEGHLPRIVAIFANITGTEFSV